MKEPSIAHAELPKFVERLEWLFFSRRRPLLLGEISAEVGCSLEQASRQLEVLVDQGRLRRLSALETPKFGWDLEAIAFAEI